MLGDTECWDRATSFVEELANFQANDETAGLNTGYLSGFPESDFDALEAGNLTNGNVPYYAIHKTLAGLLDVWRYIDDDNACDVLLALAGWVDTRTGKLSTNTMQAMLETEFGGLNEVLAEFTTRQVTTTGSRLLNVSIRPYCLLHWPRTKTISMDWMQTLRFRSGSVQPVNTRRLAIIFTLISLEISRV